MSTSEINVVPKNIGFEVVKLDIAFDMFVLNAVDGNVTVRYITVNGITVKIENIYIPPNIYSQWGNNDSFIIDYVLQQINFEKQ